MLRNFLYKKDTTLGVETAQQKHKNEAQPKYPDPAKLVFLRTQTLLYRFKPFHWKGPVILRVSHQRQSGFPLFHPNLWEFLP